MLYPNIYGDAARASGDIGFFVELGGSTLLFVFKYHFYFAASVQFPLLGHRFISIVSG